MESKVSNQQPVCENCGHHEKFRGVKTGLCQYPFDGAKDNGGIWLDSQCGCRCVFPPVPQPVINECFSCAICELSVFMDCPDCKAEFCQSHYITHMQGAHGRKMTITIDPEPASAAPQAEHPWKDISMERQISRGHLLRNNLAARLDIAFQMVDANYWNREVRQWGEKKINPDPDGVLASAFLRLTQEFDDLMEPIQQSMKRHEEAFGWPSVVE